ncbi:hypothetical protein BS17DRAFT_836018 [Gyrodon lividus]|nr:hypothetical protein BS17DRAFT_836018 [Gyrodon lividus]
MPTLSISAALLLFGNTEGLLWNCLTWQALTNSTGVPWETEENALPQAPATHIVEWTTGLAQSIKAYAQNLWSQPVIDEVFMEHKCGLYDTLVRFKAKKLPTLEESQASNTVTTPLAYTLFGEDAYVDGDPMFLCSEVKVFTELNDKHLAPISQGIESGSYGSRKKESCIGQQMASIEELEEQKKRMEAMLAAAQNDDMKKEEVEKLPKALRDALRKLASEQEIREVEHLIKAAMENIEPDNSSVEISDGQTIDFPWQEGVKDLGQLTEEQLTPSPFQEFMDPDAIIEPWSKEGAAWLANPESRREPLRPQWHQLVGILWMLQ